MSHIDIPLARRDVIAGRLRDGQSVIATALALEFDVSEDAIRRDLRALAAEGVCRRVYGGALPLSDDTPMIQRVNEGQAQKARLAKAGAATIRLGELIFLDSGSTNLALVELLPDDFELTVVTNSIVIAAALLPRSDIRLICLGGNVTHQLGGCVDSSAFLQVSRINIDRAFIGACSVSVEGGVCAIDYADSVFKRQVVQSSKHNIVLATNEKFTKNSLHQIAEVSEFDHLIVEHDLAQAEFDAYASLNVQVTRAE